MDNISIFLKKRLKRLGYADCDVDVDETMFTYNDGGMYACGDKFADFTSRQKVGRMDNVAAQDHIRAIAIASELSWVKVKEEYNQFYDEHGKKSKKKIIACSTSRQLEHAKCVKAFVEEVLGWKWVPVMKIGSGVKMHCRRNELPRGNLILRCSKYYMASVDGVIHDSYDFTRAGTRAVYGYWESEGLFTAETYRLITGEEL